MTKIGVIGCAGRMGRAICEAVVEDPETELAGGTERPGHELVGNPLSVIISDGGWKGEVPVISDDLSKIIGDLDAVIDFSIPVATIANLDIAAETGTAIVIGTTGFSKREIDHIRSKSPEVRCVMAPNMSVGVILMFKLVAEAARAIGNDYDMEILDIHHNKKKDAPSGTAVRLAEICARETGRDLAKTGVYGREGNVGERTKEEIGIMTLRAGDVVGEHTVMFAGPGERVEISHKAGSRSNFALGAVRAAKWVTGQTPGLYDMQDVLGLG
jgi:4-hydroxy-tetrahydrodipicolinate reductase